MTAIQTPYPPDADRFYRTANVPAPPETAPGRRLYLDDAVTEAIGELRRRLRSSREEMVTQALFAILDLEKHKLRHGRPISGTHVPYLGELDDYPERRLILPNGAEPPLPNVGTEAPQQHGPIRQNQALLMTGTVPIAQVSIPTTTLVAGREAGATVPESPPPSPDERPSRLILPNRAEPLRLRGPIRENQPTEAAADLRRFERMREAYLESTGRYAEDEFPDNPAYHRFRDEPRPHPAFLRYLCRQYGTGDDTLPLGTEPESGTVPAVPLGPWRPPPDTS